LKRKVRLARTVYSDFDRLADFLATKNPRAAASAIAKLRQAILSLAEYSERGRPSRRTGLRELVVPYAKAAYVVVYLVEQNTVVVLRIFHSREDRQPYEP
jgi:plasmid stabilization system protein ParE